MFGANPFGWPQFGQAYAGTVSSGGITITLGASGVLALASDGASTTTFLPDGGKATLAADDAAFWPILAQQCQTFLLGDDAGLGLQTPTPGALALQADPPLASGPTFPSSGQLRLAAAAPTIWTSITPISGALVITADAPTFQPTGVTAGKLALAADAPVLIPSATAAGKVVLAADAAAVYPLGLSSSGRLLLFSDAGVALMTGIDIESSGILRLRSDIPIVTPLTEPPPAPPPTRGVGIAAAAVIA